VVVPGSKSATARSLVLAALADGPSRISGGLAARDSDLMIAALRQLGAVIDTTGPTWTVVPPDRPIAGGAVEGGLAGTVLRFVPPLAALAEGETAFRGDPAAAARPVAPLLDALAQLGATVEGSALPFAVSGPLIARRAVIDASASSQFVSGLLLAAARFPQGLELRHRGGPIPSLPHIELTAAALADHGVALEWMRPGPDSDPGRSEHCWRVAPGAVRAVDETIEPDLTTAAVFLAAALVAGGSVTVPAWPARTSQPGAVGPQLLTGFGGDWRLDRSGLTVTGDGRLQGQELDLSATSELVPVLAGLAALAEGETRLRGVAHIRGHETDRLAALAHNLTALGGRCAETADGLLIAPARLHGGSWPTWGDHRLAHAGALIGLRVTGVELDDIAVVAKTMPDFARVWRETLT
jgi:3-phosphoshikimate 1-carboxyvinyltransferase